MRELNINTRLITYLAHHIAFIILSYTQGIGGNSKCLCYLCKSKNIPLLTDSVNSPLIYYNRQTQRVFLFAYAATALVHVFKHSSWYIQNDNLKISSMEQCVNTHVSRWLVYLTVKTIQMIEQNPYKWAIGFQYALK